MTPASSLSATESALRRRYSRPREVITKWLDLDDIRTLVRQDHGRSRAGEHLAQVNNAVSGKRAFGHFISSQHSIGLQRAVLVAAQFIAASG